MNIPGKGEGKGEPIREGGWCFGDGLSSLWGGSVANWQCVLWHSNSNSKSECVVCNESLTLLDLYSQVC